MCRFSQRIRLTPSRRRRLCSGASRRGVSRLSAAGLGLAIGLIFLVHCSGAAAERSPESPFVRLFDTGALASRPLPDKAIADGGDWTLLAEDDVAHDFRGDAVLRNDRVAVVVRRNGSGAEVYSRTRDGPRRRAILVASPTEEASEPKLRALKIVENNPGAGALAASFVTPAGDASSMEIRLTTGQPILEVRPRGETRRLLLRDEPRYLVVPDFFADDMVFGGESKQLRFGLPTENLLLHLLADGDALAMCVWKSQRQNADALMVEADGRRRLAGCAIQCVEDEPIWIAWMEGRGLWHRAEIPLASARDETILDWKPPFPAKWRADFVGSDAVCQSSEFGDEESAGACCRLDRGRVVARVPSNDAAAPGALAAPVIIYPMDRSRSTPLTALTPADVVRNTLGVGPCQYILATEGFDPNSTPTPAQTMDWIERQFQRRKAKESAEAIDDLLRDMVDHVALAQARIQRYAELAADVRTLCRTRGSGDTAVQLDAVARTLGDTASASSPGEGPASLAGRLARDVVALIGRDSALPDCERLGASIRRLGAAQDRALSKCRMLTRWLSQMARAQAVSGSDPAPWVAEIRSRIDEVLRVH